MALEVLDQFVNSGFCITRGSLVWCLKSQYLEILKAELPNTFKKGLNSPHKPRSTFPFPRQPFKPRSN